MIKQYIIITAMLFMVLLASAQKRGHAGRIDITPVRLEHKGDFLYIELIYDIKGSNVDSRRSISFFPYLASKGQRLDLPPIMVKGRNSYSVYERELALMCRKQRAKGEELAPYAVVKGYKKKQRIIIDYNQRIPYQKWMANASLDIQKDIEGCNKAPRTLAISQLVGSIQHETTTFAFAYIQPSVEVVKYREMESVAFLDFVVSKTDIHPDYMSNHSELKKITDIIYEVKNDPNIIVKSISVVGYASPEGSLSLNKQLSEGRANSLIEYLASRFDYPQSLYKIEFGGENWDGLREAIVASKMENKAELINIIDNTPVKINYKENISRKKALMDFKNGVPYRYMLKEFYPSLRKAICKIDYEVKGVTVDVAKELIMNKPQNLSLNEMFLIANTYEKGSQNFIDVFETVVRMFPADQTANLNAAVAALERNDLMSAERYLENIEDPLSAEYYNAMGILLIAKGELSQAENFLQRASEMGLGAANTNLRKLSTKSGNIKH